MSLRVKISKQNYSTTKRLAIIGFGASGIISFYNLVKNHDEKHLLEIEIFDRNIGVSKGMAYATKNINHLLNVRAKNMSALESDKDHFVTWLAQNGYKYGAQDFVPRAIYNLYLDFIIAQSCAIADLKNIKYNFNHQDIFSIKKEKGYFVVKNEAYNYCLLCVGAQMENVAQNFWQVDLGEFLQDREIHILGAGLTAFDAVISLVDAGYQSTIFLHSRSNHLPQENLAHTISGAIPAPLDLQDAALPLSKIFHKFVAACKNSPDWRATFDAFRPLTSQFWQKLDAAKKQRFLRHCFRLWNTHRHRCPSEQYRKIENLIATKKIILTKEKIVTQKFIDCRGFNFLTKSALLKNLVDNDIAKLDEIGLGVVSLSDNFKIIGANNFGSLFETTAIPELRQQGAAINFK